MNILAAFLNHAAAHPDRIAIIDGSGRATSYGALAARAEGLAARWQAQGLCPGDAVLIARGIDADLYAALAALWRIGAVAVLPEPALGLAGVRHAVRALAPRALCTAGFYRLLPLLVPSLLGRRALSARVLPAPCTVANLDPAAPALVSFTTGSTGAPKAIVRSHGFLAAQDRAVAPLIAPQGRPEIDLVSFPVFVVANLGQGITSVLPNWPLRDPAKARGAAISAHMARHGVTRLLLNPAIVEAVAPLALPATVHTIFTGGGPVFPDVIDGVRRANPSVRVVAVYGSTEAEPIAHLDATEISPADDAAMDAGAGLLAGTVAEGTKVRIVDNEILVAGDHVVAGYLDPAQDVTTKLRDGDGTIWHRTGDAGRIDDQGRLWLLGRLQGRIGTVWPFAIEAPARRWPGVARAALVNTTRGPELAIEGDAKHRAEWDALARQHGLQGAAHVGHIPMDRRHGSKVDRAALEKILA